ncbi:MAG: 16S rRNA (guanine(527)-N(7))-methyltransferase RsmG [Candidatus Cloacimonetes bacterium]|nr:16S rRNA (guanine(527)-N(7))-methyltransferase RsmG [Candidatus Cloacimonadota bacterium]
MGNQEVFYSFLRQEYPDKAEDLLAIFARYGELLREFNRIVNLVSRKTPYEEYWTKHFLDAILPVKQMDFSGKRLLDVGTGGGLPGIPLAIVNEPEKVILLDSRFRKMEAVKIIIKKLDLKNCFTLVSRLENMDREWEDYFDFIVCRSVRILPGYPAIFNRLLKPAGRIILYKGKNVEELEYFPSCSIHDVSHPALGDRKLIIIDKIRED